MHATPNYVFPSHALCNGIANPFNTTRRFTAADMIPSDVNATYVSVSATPDPHFQQPAPRTPPAYRRAIDWASLYVQLDAVGVKKASNPTTPTRRSPPASPAKSPVSHAAKTAFVVAYLQSQWWSDMQIASWLAQVKDEAVRSLYRRVKQKEDGGSPTPRARKARTHNVPAVKRQSTLDARAPVRVETMNLRSISNGSTTSTSSTDSWPSLASDGDNAFDRDVDLADFMPFLGTTHDDNDTSRRRGLEDPCPGLRLKMADDVPDIESFDAEAVAEQLAIYVAVSERPLSPSKSW